MKQKNFDMSAFQKTPWVKQRWCALVLMVLGLVAGPAALAQTAGDPNKYSSTPGNAACRFFDGFADYGDGTVTDPRNGLMWKRCAEGSVWNGKACSAAGSRMNWVEAMKAAKASRYLEKNDWRLPTEKELLAVVGEVRPCGGYPGTYAASAVIAHSVQQDAENPGRYWSSTPHATDDKRASAVSFNSGGGGGYPRLSILEVRLVRSVQTSIDSTSREFDAEFDTRVEPILRAQRESLESAKRTAEIKVIEAQRLAEQRMIENAKRDAELRRIAELEAIEAPRRAAEARRQAEVAARQAAEAKRKSDIARAAAAKSLLTQGPQGLYLQAGRAQRDGGGVRINGEYFSAKQMYDLIVDNFPKSEFAVKASDQLNAMARGEAQERSEREARGRAWCEAELRRREASCNTAENPAGCVSYHRNSFRCD